MSDALDQGITVTELNATGEPVGVADISTAAFVGRALRGPLNTPVLVKSFAAFQHRFGGIWGRSSLGPAVQQFFEHGGRELYVVRVANNARGAMICLPSDHGVLVLHATEPGSTENIRAAVDYDGIDGNDHEHFNLTVQRIAPTSGLVVDQEIYRALSCRPDSERHVADVLSQSSLVSVDLPAPPGRPIATSGPGLDADDQYVGHAQRGTDGDELSDYDLVGSSRDDTGLFALNAVEHFDLLYVPPCGRHHDLGPAAVLAAELYCRKRGAMLILDPPAAWTDVGKAIDGVRESGYASSNVVTYFPRMRSKSDPVAEPRAVGGALAGLLCKLDRHHGPWEELDQPGYGFNRDLKPAVPVSAEEGALLVREGVNVIAGAYAGRATFCGSVTLARNSQVDRRFTSLTVQRLCLHLTNTIERATRWAVFKAGGPRIALQVRAQVYAYLESLADRGAFEERHFDVQCSVDRHAYPLDAERGVTMLLAFQPADSDEFVWLTLHQSVQGCRVSSTAFAPVTAECA